METILAIIGALIFAALLYLIHLNRKKNSGETEFATKFYSLSTDVQNTIMENLNGLQKSVNENFKEGRSELKQIHSENIDDSRRLLQGLMGMVEERMDQMGKGLGEISKTNQFMHMLFNPAARGRVGEVQLEGLLTDILAPTQFEKNFKPNPTESFRVEFAVKMPTDLGQSMYLPIDSKFPREEYERLMEAETKEDIARYQRALRTKVKDFAKQISKYIHMPRTTEMAIMYLPDGIYDWVVTQHDLISEIRNEHKVVVVGPSTLWIIISFVSYFFRLMAINDKSREVWNLLGKFKKQIGLTTEVLDNAIKYNDRVAGKLNELKTTRYNVMLRELRDIQEDIEDGEHSGNAEAA